MEAARKIDVNSADARNLTQLPGIGLNVAKKIVAYRRRHGGVIHEWDELLNVVEFPGDRLEEIKARATLELPSGRPVSTRAGVLHHFPGQPTRKKIRK